LNLGNVCGTTSNDDIIDHDLGEFGFLESLSSEAERLLENDFIEFRNLADVILVERLEP
jgi:hypothetical protein